MDRSILKFVVLILLSCTAMLTSAADKASGTDKAAVKVSADSKVKKPVRVIAPVYVPPRRAHRWHVSVVVPGGAVTSSPSWRLLHLNTPA